SRLVGAHVRFGAADPKEGFPAGTTFTAPLLMANPGLAATEAHVFVDYTSGSESKQVDLGVMSLAPGEVKQLELAGEVGGRSVSATVKDAGLEINYTGSPGSVIARLVSVDKSGDFAFDVPIKDPQVGLNGVRGNYPLRLDVGYTTVLHLKNVTDKEVYAV